MNTSYSKSSISVNNIKRNSISNRRNSISNNINMHILSKLKSDKNVLPENVIINNNINHETNVNHNSISRETNNKKNNNINDKVIISYDDISYTFSIKSNNIQFIDLKKLLSIIFHIDPTTIELTSTDTIIEILSISTWLSTSSSNVIKLSTSYSKKIYKSISTLSLTATPMIKQSKSLLLTSDFNPSENIYKLEFKLWQIFCHYIILNNNINLSYISRITFNRLLKDIRFNLDTKIIDTFLLNSYNEMANDLDVITQTKLSNIKGVSFSMFLSFLVRVCRYEFHKRNEYLANSTKLVDSIDYVLEDFYNLIFNNILPLHNQLKAPLFNPSNVIYTTNSKITFLPLKDFTVCTYIYYSNLTHIYEFELMYRLDYLFNHYFTCLKNSRAVFLPTIDLGMTFPSFVNMVYERSFLPKTVSLSTLAFIFLSSFNAFKSNNPILYSDILPIDNDETALLDIVLTLDFYSFLHAIISISMIDLSSSNYKIISGGLAFNSFTPKKLKPVKVKTIEFDSIVIKLHGLFKFSFNNSILTKGISPEYKDPCLNILFKALKHGIRNFWEQEFIMDPLSAFDFTISPALATSEIVTLSVKNYSDNSSFENISIIRNSLSRKASLPFKFGKNHEFSKRRLLYEDLMRFVRSLKISQCRSYFRSLLENSLQLQDPKLQISQSSSVDSTKFLRTDSKESKDLIQFLKDLSDTGCESELKYVDDDRFDIKDLDNDSDSSLGDNESVLDFDMPELTNTAVVKSELANNFILNKGLRDNWNKNIRELDSKIENIIKPLVEKNNFNLYNDSHSENKLSKINESLNISLDSTLSKDIQINDENTVTNIASPSFLKSKSIIKLTSSKSQQSVKFTNTPRTSIVDSKVSDLKFKIDLDDKDKSDLFIDSTAENNWPEFIKNFSYSILTESLLDDANKGESKINEIVLAKNDFISADISRISSSQKITEEVETVIESALPPMIKIKSEPPRHSISRNILIKELISPIPKRSSSLSVSYTRVNQLTPLNPKLETLSSILSSQFKHDESLASKRINIVDNTPNKAGIIMTRGSISASSEITATDSYKSFGEWKSTEDDKSFEKALFMAAYDGRIAEVSERLKDRMVDVRDPFGNEDTLLIISGMTGNKKLAKLCLRLGADINAVNKQGQTVLHYCGFTKNTELANYLISKEADVGIKNYFGYTWEEGLRPKDDKTALDLLLRHKGENFQRSILNIHSYDKFNRNNEWSFTIPRANASDNLRRNHASSDILKKIIDVNEITISPKAPMLPPRKSLWPGSNSEKSPFSFQLINDRVILEREFELQHNRLEALKNGFYFKKYGRQGLPHQRKVFIASELHYKNLVEMFVHYRQGKNIYSEELNRIVWRAEPFFSFFKPTDHYVLLFDVIQATIGVNCGIFYRYFKTSTPEPSEYGKYFSIATIHRTLDLEGDNQEIVSLFVDFITFLLKHVNISS